MGRRGGVGGGGEVVVEGVVEGEGVVGVVVVEGVVEVEGGGGGVVIVGAANMVGVGFERERERERGGVWGRLLDGEEREERRGV